jgi:dienelactone hydrolase
MIKHINMAIILSIWLILEPSAHDLKEEHQEASPLLPKRPIESLTKDSVRHDLFLDDMILSFNAQNVVRIENSKSYGDPKHLKPVLIGVPKYSHSSTYFYEIGCPWDCFPNYEQGNKNHPSPPISPNYVPTLGFLNIPPGNGPFPCVILCHGSDGEAYMPDYVTALEKEGIASLSMERFKHYTYQNESAPSVPTHRTSENQFLVPLEGEIIHTLFAAKVIATHPKIDSTMIGFWGFSRGGNVALSSCMSRYLSRIAPDLRPAFCIDYYGMPLVHWRDPLTIPTLFIHGANDDYTPVSNLLDHIKHRFDLRFDLPSAVTERVMFTSRNELLKTIIYPNAGHAFDSFPKPSSKQLIYYLLTDPRKFFSSILNNPREFFRTILTNVQLSWYDLVGGSMKIKQTGFMKMSSCCVCPTPNEKGFVDADSRTHLWYEYPDYLRSRAEISEITIERNPAAARDARKEAISFIKKHTLLKMKK